MRTLVSLPAWECGLKLMVLYTRLAPTIVTPCVGVWIEIRETFLIRKECIVTPCVGVWIEIC